jgi:hypothetical protein
VTVRKAEEREGKKGAEKDEEALIESAGRGLK